MRTSGTRFIFISLAASNRISQSFLFSRNRSIYLLGGITSSSSAAAVFSKLSSTALFSSFTEQDEDEAMTTMDTMTGKSWRSLLEISMAKSRKIRGSNYVQLSTVDDNGEPRCRTVVFRGFLKLPLDHELANACDGFATMLKMCTDLRSQKVQQTQIQPVAELVWWFPKTSEQYRIRGKLILIGGDYANDNDKALTVARKELWGNLSDPARESFLDSRVPGAVYSSENDDHHASPIPPGGRDPDGKPVPPPSNFLLMLMDPTQVDYLRLTGDQYRQIDTRAPQGVWSLQRVNP